MAVLTPEKVADLVATTLEHMERDRLVDLTGDIQKYTVFRNLVLFQDGDGRRPRVEETTGYQITYNLMMNHGNAARNVGLASPDIVNIVETTQRAVAPWRHSVTSWAVSTQEVAMNQDPAQILNLVRVRDIAARIDLVRLMEVNFWGPPVTSSDEITPWGVNTWLQKASTTGFNGLAPSGIIPGIDPAIFPRWRNYTFIYSHVTKDDLIRKWRTAAITTDFTPAVEDQMIVRGTNYGFYVNTSTYLALADLMEAQNESLGPDLASMDGRQIFMRVPVERVPYLDADTTNPVYGLNWSYIRLFTLRDHWLRRTQVAPYPGQHNVTATFLDMTYNWVFLNRRVHFVGATGTSYPS